jgi:heme A synthase
MTSGLLTAVAATLVLAAAAVTGGEGRWVRRLASVTLLAVMVQGLLGGYRVYLDQQLGVALSAVHGTFAQVVFCLFLVTLAMTRTPRYVPADEFGRIGWPLLSVPTAVFVQLVWGALVRHAGSPVMQRLHLLTAFVVVGLVLLLAVRIRATDAGRRHLGGAAVHLLGVVGIQVLLGVEAWMGKFAATGPQAGLPPTLRTVTIESAVVRSLHALVGAALLASAVLLAVRAWRCRSRPVAWQSAPARPELVGVA